MNDVRLWFVDWMPNKRDKQKIEHIGIFESELEAMGMCRAHSLAKGTGHDCLARIQYADAEGATEYQFGDYIIYPPEWVSSNHDLTSDYWQNQISAMRFEQRVSFMAGMRSWIQEEMDYGYSADADDKGFVPVGEYGTDREANLDLTVERLFESLDGEFWRPLLESCAQDKLIRPVKEWENSQCL